MNTDRLLTCASTLSISLGSALLARQQRLVLVESCTGGLVAASLSALAGSSQWFEGGWVVYSNATKQHLLGVDAQLLATQGAVSEAVALALVSGALQHCQQEGQATGLAANLAASITGIAGPGGGTLEKPVGTVCFAWGGLHYPSHSTTRHFSGDRAEIRQQAAAYCLQMLLAMLENPSDVGFPKARDL